MEISSGNSGVQIAIAVQPPQQPARSMETDNAYDGGWGASSASIEVPPSPSLNTSGQEVGSILNTWA